MIGRNATGLGFIGPPPKQGPAHIIFEDHLDFKPNLTPKQILSNGSFGGGYFRNIYSKITKESYQNTWQELPEDWIIDLPQDYYASEKYKININKYRVRAGVQLDSQDKFGLDYWESKAWIIDQDPYGWFQWYCRFYQGRRSKDDSRQISRWLNCCGPKGRWKVNLIRKCVRANKKYNDFTVSPIIRQTLQHWAYELTEEDYEIEKKRMLATGK